MSCTKFSKEITKWLKANGPVSYTHRDVYKRQDNILFGMDEITADVFFKQYKEMLDRTVSYGFPACCSIEELRERMDTKCFYRHPLSLSLIHIFLMKS